MRRRLCASLDKEELLAPLKVWRRAARAWRRRLVRFAVTLSLDLPGVKFSMPGVDYSSCGENTNDIAILGCGIIGLCTAYYLTESGATDPKTIHLVDSSPELFQCASGLAAGFLSADCTYGKLPSRLGWAWRVIYILIALSDYKSGFAPSVSSLGALSFKLHADLANAHSGRSTWGYSQSTGISLSQDSESAIGGSGEDWLENGTSRAQLANHNKPWEEQAAGPEWLRRTQEGIMEVISRDGTTAQIDPLRFCQWLLKEVKERGVRIHQPARATATIKDADDVLCGLRILTGDDAESDTECKIPVDNFDFHMATDNL